MWNLPSLSFTTLREISPEGGESVPADDLPVSGSFLGSDFVIEGHLPCSSDKIRYKTEAGGQ
jgi:hypothetical protein